MDRRNRQHLRRLHPGQRGLRQLLRATAAERLARIGLTKPKYAGLTRRTKTGRLVWTGRVRYCPDTLKDLHKGPPRKIFLTVEGDPFHAKVLDWQLEEVFAIHG
jgi:protein gp37